MNFRIVPASGLVEIGEKSVTIDLSAFPAGVAEVRWFGSSGLRILSDGGDEHGLPVERFTDPTPYLGYVEAAQAAIIVRDTPVPPTLAEIKAAAKAQIDALAGMARVQFITDAPGQDATYLKKEEQAIALLAELDEAEQAQREPDLPEDEFYLMYGEVGITGDDLREVAEAVLVMAALWKPAARAIESMRVGSKKQVSLAADAEAVAAILNALSWPVAP